jgi:mono/diheme cytochrome c family protein
MSKLSRRERQAAQSRQQQKRQLVWGMFGLGRQVYDGQCASCHGANLEGEENWREPGPNGLLKAPPHDETGHTWHHDDAYLIESIKLGGPRLPADVGISPMPAYVGILSDEEITAVLSFIKSQWPADILAAQSQR